MTVAERVSRLEGIVGSPHGDETLDLVSMIADLHEKFESMQAVQMVVQQHLDRQSALVARLMEKNGALEDEVSLLKRALASGPNSSPIRADQPVHVKIPEPSVFLGKRDAKELENFLWDMENYLKAMRIPESDQVTLAAMFLGEDAKLWWRTRMMQDLSVGRPHIDSWDELKKELRDQFLPCNTGWIARAALKELKQDGTVRDYVKRFSSLLLDIGDMSEADKVFNFLSGLQPWAQTELRRQGVKEVSSAIAAAEMLVDFHRPQPKAKSSERTRRADNEKSANRWWNQRKDQGKAWNNKRKASASGSGSQSPKGKKADWGCFICGEPHYARNCPKKGALGSLVSQSVQQEAVEQPTSRLNPMQLINAIGLEWEVARRFSGLMYTKAKINGTRMQAMLDTGATHNFMSGRRAEALKLKVFDNPGKVKAASSRTLDVCGWAEVRLELGDWQSSCTVMIGPFEDFELILGMDFLVRAKVSLMPHLGGILIGEGVSPNFVKVEMDDGSKQGGMALATMKMDELRVQSGRYQRHRRGRRSSLPGEDCHIFVHAHEVCVRMTEGGRRTARHGPGRARLLQQVPDHGIAGTSHVKCSARRRAAGQARRRAQPGAGARAGHAGREVGELARGAGTLVGAGRTDAGDAQTQARALAGAGRAGMDARAARG